MFRRTLRGFRPCPRRASGAPPRASKGQVVREDGHATRPLRPDWGALHHKGGRIGSPDSPLRGGLQVEPGCPRELVVARGRGGRPLLPHGRLDK
jgi:hypothetical protein